MAILLEVRSVDVCGNSINVELVSATCHNLCNNFVFCQRRFSTPCLPCVSLVFQSGLKRCGIKGITVEPLELSKGTSNLDVARGSSVFFYNSSQERTREA